MGSCNPIFLNVIKVDMFFFRFLWASCGFIIRIRFQILRCPLVIWVCPQIHYTSTIHGILMNNTNFLLSKEVPSIAKKQPLVKNVCLSLVWVWNFVASFTCHESCWSISVSSQFPPGLVQNLPETFPGLKPAFFLSAAEAISSRQRMGLCDQRGDHRLILREGYLFA